MNDKILYQEGGRQPILNALNKEYPQSAVGLIDLEGDNVSLVDVLPHVRLVGDLPVQDQSHFMRVLEGWLEQLRVAPLAVDQRHLVVVPDLLSAAVEPSLAIQKAKFYEGS